MLQLDRSNGMFPGEQVIILSVIRPFIGIIPDDAALVSFLT